MTAHATLASNPTWAGELDRACPRPVRTVVMSDLGTKEIAPSRDRFTGLLVAVSRDRNRTAFKDLFEHFAPRLRSYFLRGGTNPGLVDELVQETMINVWRRSDTFDPDRASAATWIFTVGRNKRIDLVRRERRPSPDPNDPAMTPDPEPTAHHLMVTRAESDELHEVLVSLPEAQRIVLHMAFFEDKPHTRIAEDLGLPLGTVKSRIRLAMTRLRADLERKA